MKWRRLATEHCSIARTVAVIGDRWTLLLLRDCFLGVRRFEDFSARLGISRTITASRLRALTAHGILRREQYQQAPPRHEYRLTPKGLDLYPVIMAMVQFGNEHYAGPEGPPVLHRHRACGHDFHAVSTCSACHAPLDPRQVEVRPGSVLL